MSREYFCFIDIINFVVVFYTVLVLFSMCLIKINVNKISETYLLVLLFCNQINTGLSFLHHLHPDKKLLGKQIQF